MSRPQPDRTFKADQMHVEVFRDRPSCGQAAAHDVAERMRGVLAEQETLSVLFASGRSQREMLAALRKFPQIYWPRVIAFHMDEYIGLPAEHSEALGQWLRDHLIRHVPMAQVHYINGNAPDLLREAERYTTLLRQHPVDVLCLGIGENGHIAFNDPHVADFHDPMWMKVVELDEVCRTQQVHDGAFTDLKSVPRRALTLTIPALLASRWVATVVPGPTKAAAVRDTIEGPIGPACPASILRNYPAARLYLDRDSAALLE